MTDYMEAHAREKAGLPPEWRAYRYRTLPEGSRECLYLGVTGAVVPDKKRGKNAGRPNWRSKEISHEQEVYFTPAEHEQWLLAWEAKNGKCHQCDGNGQQWFGWSIDGGNRYQPCSRCNATGIPPQQTKTSEAA